jgi:hypothetical protein
MAEDDVSELLAPYGVMVLSVSCMAMLVTSLSSDKDVLRAWIEFRPVPTVAPFDRSLVIEDELGARILTLDQESESDLKLGDEDPEACSAKLRATASGFKVADEAEESLQLQPESDRLWLRRCPSRYSPGTTSAGREETTVTRA